MSRRERRGPVGLDQIGAALITRLARDQRTADTNSAPGFSSKRCTASSRTGERLLVPRRRSR